MSVKRELTNKKDIFASNACSFSLQTDNNNIIELQTDNEIFSATMTKRYLNLATKFKRCILCQKLKDDVYFIYFFNVCKVR